MRRRNKKIISFVAVFSSALLCLASLSGCSNEEGKKKKVEYKFETIYSDNNTKTLEQYDAGNPTKNGEVSYEVNKNVGSKNYMRICLDTDVNLVGYITYSNTQNSEESNKEKFYIEAGTKEFTTFLDAYRGGAFGAYEKNIECVSLQNVDATKAGTVTLKSIDFSDRAYDPDEMMYIEDGTLRVGTSLGFGGTITYLARINANIKEYVDAEGNMRIGRLLDEEGVNLVSETSNLVNTHDLGREIQQSFYWPVNEMHGYVPTSEQKYPGNLNYNPIQCGSAGAIGPQIADYYCTEDEIYVKAYGQDWYLENQVDATYFETWLSFGADGVLKVKNKITNFAQFVDTEPLEFVHQETPAFYSVYPLNYFYAETKQGTIFDNALCSSYSNAAIKTALNDGVTGEYHYRLPAEQVEDDWVAFVTEDKFGLGIYNPSANYFFASSGIESIAYSETDNQKTNRAFYEDDYSSYIPSCYAYSYGYLNPTIYCQMVDFVPLEYSYALYAGDVAEMRSAFGQLKATGEMVAEDIAWPVKEAE